jgi:hypothetical protein
VAGSVGDPSAWSISIPIADDESAVAAEDVQGTLRVRA